jgi:hypothetical protein
MRIRIDNDAARQGTVTRLVSYARVLGAIPMGRYQMIATLFSLVLLTSPVTFLEEKPLYENPIAYPRSPESGLALRQSTFFGERVQYLEGIIGKTVPIVDYKNTWQFGLEAATWVMLGYDDGAFPLLTQDFYFSFPVYFKLYQLTGALKFNHISSHKGDGIDGILEQNLSDEEKAKLDEVERYSNLDVNLVERVAYSRDYLSADFAFEHRIRGFDTKTYVRGGYAHKMIPENLKRWFFGYGTEIKYKLLFYAHDITYNQDVDSIDYSAQAGIMLNSGGLFECRLAMTGYHGSDRRGQFLGRKLNQIGIGVFFR